MVRKIHCSPRVPRFGSEHPHGGLEPSVIPASGDLCLLMASYMHVVHTHTYIHTHIKNYKPSKNKN